MTHRLHNVVYAALATIANAEKITRTTLAEMSRDLLEYVPDTDDIDVVNRLLGVLTPMNKQTMILYLRHFLPWEAENDKDGTFQRFGKRMKGERKVKARLDLIKKWLKKPENNVWTWAETNVDLKKKKDLPAAVERAIHQALNGAGKKGQSGYTPPVSHDVLFNAIFAGLGEDVPIGEMLDAITQKMSEPEQGEETHPTTEGLEPETIAALQEAGIELEQAA